MNPKNIHQRFITPRLFMTLFIFISITIFTSFSSKSGLPPVKIKFTSMLMKQADLLGYSQKPKFSHFLFQNANLDNTSGRNSFELVVYAYDSVGKQLNPNPRLLTSALKQPAPPVNERSDNIYFGNYFLSKDQYERIVTSYTPFDNLKFVAESINASESYPNYITYKIIPVTGSGETPVAKSLKIVLLAGDDYLKPSPPAIPPSFISASPK